MGNCGGKRGKLVTVKLPTKVEDSRTEQNLVNESEIQLHPKANENTIKIKATYLMGKAVDQKVEENYKILTKLGKGAFGSVYKVLHNQTKIIRAMKIIKKESLLLQDDDRKFLKEISILIATDHPNIIKIYEYYEDNVNYYLITEYVSGGELYDTIANWKIFNEEKAGYIMYQILSAINYLHSMKIVHRDIKPENILVEKMSGENMINIKLIDFGTCNFFDEKKKLSLKVGTPYYIAPEVLKKNYNEKVDIWSCGVIFYILLVGYPPFNGNSIKEILDNVREGKYDIKGEEWDKVSKSAKDLVKKMLQYNPNNRISSQEAVNHEWLLKMYHKQISEDVDNDYFSRVLRNIKNFNAKEKFQQATLAYIVHFFHSSSEIDDLRKIFQALDTNGDGRLTFKELKDGFEKVFGKHLSQSEISNIMEGVDQDNNGYIEYQEFLRVTLNKKTLISEENLQMAFDKFDLNNDGKLSKNEILELFGASESEYINNLIKVIDKNGDGEISYPEFCEMMRRIVYNTSGETILLDSPKRSPRVSIYTQEKMLLKEKKENGKVIELLKLSEN